MVRKVMSIHLHQDIMVVTTIKNTVPGIEDNGGSMNSTLSFPSSPVEDAQRTIPKDLKPTNFLGKRLATTISFLSCISSKL